MISQDDDSSPCDNIKNIFESHYILPFGAALSSICYLYLFYVYFFKRHPALMRHPSTIAIYKCIFEFMFVQQYLWEPFLPNDIFYSGAAESGSDHCRASTFAAVLAFLSQFFLLGGELVFLVISIDLYMAYTNPFSSFSQYKGVYAVVVFGISLATATILIFSDAYGVASEGVVWIQDQKGQNNLPKILLFYVFMAVIYSYCILTVLILSHKLKKGIAKSLEARLSIMKRSQTYIIGYSIFWGVMLSSELISFLIYQQNSSHRAARYVEGFASGAAYCLAFRGVWALLVLRMVNKDGFKLTDWTLDAASIAVEEGMSMKPHLNSALRAEILYFTTQGIIFSANEFHRPGHGESPEDVAGAGEIDPRQSSFSFKDKLHLGRSSGAGEDLGSLFRNSMSLFGLNQGSIPARASDVSRASVASSVDPLVAISKGTEMQQQKIIRTINQEMDREIRELGISTGSSFRTSNKISKEAKDSMRMEEQMSPFDAHAELDRLGGGARPGPGTRDSDRHSLASSASSAASASSSSTVKWRDTNDLQFRMVHSAASMEGEETKWERVSSRPGPLHSTSTASTDMSAFQLLKNSVVGAMLRTSTAARRVVGGFYDEFTFTDYGSRMFARVRAICGIRPSDYVAAFSTTTNEKFTEGRSGAFMFSSGDCRFIAKTTTREELLKLLDIMPSYIDHLEKNPKTFILKFLGAHCIKMYSRKIYFLVMMNVFPKERLSEKYDLKGSWINRSSNWGNGLTRREKMKLKASSLTAPLLLDNDLQQKISLHSDVAVALRLQVQRDTKFLQSHNIMDYSLLVGVVRRHFEVVPREMESEEEIMKLTSSSPANNPTLAQRRRTISERPDPFQMDDSGGMHAESVEAPGTYYLGIIDTLQEWNWSKEFERYYKLYVLGQDGAGISAIEPKRYQERFMKRVVNDIFEGLGESSRAVSQITDTQSICILSTTPRNSEAARDDSILY